MGLTSELPWVIGLGRVTVGRGSSRSFREGIWIPRASCPLLKSTPIKFPKLLCSFHAQTTTWSFFHVVRPWVSRGFLDV